MGAAVASLSAWWASWKWVAILAALLLASVWLNIVQYGNRVAAKAEAKAQGYAEALDRSNGIAKAAQDDNTQLLAELEKIAERSRRTKIVYSKAAAAAPLASQCSPGQGRIDAVNQALGPRN